MSIEKEYRKVVNIVQNLLEQPTTLEERTFVAMLVNVSIKALIAIAGDEYARKIVDSTFENNDEAPVFYRETIQ